MPTYENDHRTTATISYESSIAGGTPSKGQRSFARRQGLLHSFSGSNEGKFIPGQFRVNDMKASKATWVYGTGSGSVRNAVRSRYTVSGCLSAGTEMKVKGWLNRQDFWSSSMADYALQRAHASLISSDMDLGELLAELPETISMVKGGVDLILRTIRRASSHEGFTWARADRARQLLLLGKRIKALPKSVANAWLTWRYGIRPLIWDVQDLIKLANGIAVQSNFSGLRRVRGRASDRITYDFPPYTIPVVWAAFNMNAVEHVDVDRNVEATIYYSFGENWGPIHAILQKYGLHPNQFPYLLWQVVPLSFMVDWFVDVGTWVRAITPKFGINIHGSSVSQKAHIMATRKSTFTRPQGSSWTYSDLYEPVDTMLGQRIDRRKQTLSGAIPRLKPKIVLSIQQQADLLSVLLQKALKHRRH